MASTYSPNLRLELIGTGEQQGTWGSTTNTNLGTLLEQAIGGYETVTVSNSGDTTLTANNGSADQSRNMVLNLTGTISAARTVICPAIEKLYVVKNATTGGFDVTFKVSGQTGVTIPNGSTYFLYVDGTDARLINGTISSQNANNVSITGGSLSGVNVNNVSITGGSLSGVTVSNTSLSNVSVVANASSLSVRDADGSHVLSIAAGSNLTANRVFTVTTGDAARTLDISAGSVTISAAGADLINDATVADQRTTLGLGSAAVTDVASTTEVLTGTATNRSVTPDALAALWEQGADIASAGTIAIGEGGYFNVTGTTTITDIDPSTDKAGRPFALKFAGALTLTHGAALILPGGANITTAAGDIAEFVSEGTDVVRCVNYMRASGLPVVSPSSGGMTLLGTIDTSSGSGTKSLTSLTLTDYKEIVLVWIGVSCSDAAADFFVNDGTSTYAIALDSNSASHVFNGVTRINLENGALESFGYFGATTGYAVSTANTAAGTQGGKVAWGRTRYSTAFTSVSIDVNGGASWDAGSIKVYGVK